MPTLFRLFTDLTVYREITVGKLSSSFLRYGCAYILISLSLGFWVNWRYSGEAYAVFDSLTNQILTTIPESSVYDLKDGVLSGNTTTFGEYVSIDPTADAPALASSAAFFALGKTHFRLTTDSDGTHEIRSYGDEGWQNGSVTGKDIQKFVQAFKASGIAIKPYLPLLISIPIFFFYFIARLFHTLFYALLLKIVGSSVNRAYRFVHYWQLTLHTVIVADTINLLVLFVYHENYPLVFTIAFFGTTLLAYLNLPVDPKRPSEHAI